MKKILNIFLGLLFVNFVLFAQKVVVSEYYNVTGDPLGEWTELLVIEDNVDLVGFTLRDNAGSTPPPSQWTGGIRFKNHPLWRNLRAGTIIVINHRYSPYQSVDVDKRDGYIEIDAENETYFEKRCFSCIVGPEWYQKALNIAQESDILQIIDQNDNHVHALAHLPNAEGDWVNIPSPKVAYVGSIPRGGVTVRVCPGLTLSAYNKGFDTRKEETEQSADYITKGKPNNRTGNINQNQQFWRSLREPNWNSPSANARVFRDSVILAWNPIADPNPSDSVSGYLIVRIPYDLISSAQNPVDSRTYNIGDNLGSGTVVGIVNYSQATRFVDRISLQCGVRYAYRIYAFRFRRDDFHEDVDEYTARGTAYNERNFAEVVVEKSIPPKPILTISKGANKICQGDTVVLKVNNAIRYGRVTFKWYNDGNPLPETTDSLIVTTSGNYKVEIEDSLGCKIQSDPVTIEVVNYPNLILYANGNIITKDTTLILCPNEQVNFKLLGWFKYKFFKDDKLVEEANKSEWTVNTIGIYYFGADNDICHARTPKVTVKFLDLRLNVTPQNIKLLVDKNEVYKDTIVTLQNLGTDTLYISNISFSDFSFEVISPKPPFVILPNGEIKLAIRFKPLKSGTFSAKMIIEKNCNFADTVWFEGTKTLTVLIYNQDTLNFGLIPSCYDSAENSLLTLINDYGEDLELLRAEISSPFEVVEPTFPKVLTTKSNVSLKVKIRNIGNGLFTGSLKIYYKYSGLIDSLQIPVVGEFFEVKYQVIKEFQDNIELNECENSKILSFLFVNDTKVGLKLDLSTASKDLKINTLNFDVQSGDTVRITFELAPTDIGSGKAKINFTINPCEIADFLEVDFVKKGIVTFFGVDTLDFGTIYTCESTNIFKKSIPIRVIGDSLGLTKVRESITSDPFNVKFPSDSMLKDFSQIDVSFEPKLNGRFEGKVKFILEPCGNECVLFVKGEFIQGKYTVSEDTIDFGEVEVGKSLNRRTVIFNTGDTTISVESFKIDDGINFIVKPQVDLVTVLNKNDSTAFDVRFEPKTEGYFEATLEIWLGFPCNSYQKIILKGRGKAPNPNSLTLRIDEHRFRPSTIAKVPVYFSLDGASLSSIDSIIFDVGYYHRVYNVSTVYSGTFVTQSVIDYKKENIHISVDTRKQNVSEGILAYLEGMVLVGDQKIVDLTINNVKIFSNDSIKVITQNGKIIVDSVCMVDFRLISPEVLPEFNVFIEPNVLTIQVSSSQTFTNAEVYMYDLLGKCVFVEQLYNLPKGESEFKFKHNLNPYQRYFFLVRFGDAIKSIVINYKQTE
ncbi:MAG: choice-of-anchor D domain-containing protein [Bacteroidota bacterium]